MTEFLWAMGPYLIPLIALSVSGIGLSLHKRQTLKSARPLSESVFSELLDGLARVDWNEGALPVGHPVTKLLEHAGEPAPVLQARAQAEVARLEDRLSYFPALANVATLTGLFGTVCGMIGAFLSLRSGGGADPSSLAGGLGQALAATALGLLTAIPSLTAHALFQKRVNAVTGQLEMVLSALLPGRVRA